MNVGDVVIVSTKRWGEQHGAVGRIKSIVSKGYEDHLNVIVDFTDRFSPKGHPYHDNEYNQWNSYAEEDLTKIERKRFEDKEFTEAFI